MLAQCFYIIQNCYVFRPYISAVLNELQFDVYSVFDSFSR